MTPEQAAEWCRKTAVALFQLHAENPKARLLGLPGLPGDIDAANTLVVFVDRVRAERRLASSVRRCRASRRPLRPSRPSLRRKP